VLGISDGFKGMIDAVKPHFIWLKDMLYSILRMTYNILTFDIKGIKKHLEQGLVPDVVKMENMLQKKISPTLHVPKSDFEGTGTDPDPDPDPTADAIKSIGSGAQTKNITINIGSFIDKMNPQNAEINSMNKREFEKWLNEMFLRVVRGAETAI
jgi:hypothetical protein